MTTRERSSVFPFALELDEYEVANLRAGLQALKELDLDTGDWLLEILIRLPSVERLPNRPVSAQVDQVKRFAQWAVTRRV
jgi:hypothetical protein